LHDETPDGELLRRSAAGERSAFDVFVARHQGAALRFCRALARGRSGAGGDAEDGLQEAFVAAWRKAGDFRGEGSARSWLLTIARRQMARSGRRPAPEPAGDAESLERLGVAAGWGRPEAAAGEETRLGVREAFERLAPADRAVLVLRDLEGLSAGEAAVVLGIGERALKSRLHRARLRLAALFLEDDDDAR
jgi:RNA polymerase sigma-70 factor (ECF subfamily)